MTPGRPGPVRRAAWAALLSFAVPGLGQVHARAWQAGLILLAVNEALSLGLRVLTYAAPPILPVLAAVAALVAVSLALMAVAAVDAWRRTRDDAWRRTLDRPATGPQPWFRSTWVAAAALVAFGLAVDAALPFRWRSFFIPSASMVPALMVGDRILADARPGPPPARGDIVVFTRPAEPGTDFVKRVIAIAGDTIAIADGRPILNGTPLPQQPDGTMFVPEPMRFGRKAARAIETLPNGPAYRVLALETLALRTMAERTVPPGQMFVLGDNRDDSLDSRSPAFGLVPVAGVVARPTVFTWSPDRARILTTVR